MKPMKAETCEDQHLNQLRFPIYASLKLDGIRCVVKDNDPLSNTLKQIRNTHIYNSITSDPYLNCFNGFDGELLLTNTEQPEVPGVHPFNLVSSAVMGSKGNPDFTLWVFDNWNDGRSFAERYAYLHFVFEANRAVIPSFIKLLPQVICNNLAELAAFEEQALLDGYEGIMIREFTGKYKFGRSTVKGQELLKRKPFVDEECVVVGFAERMMNTNEAVENLLGRTQRSQCAEGMVPANTLGKLLVRNKKWGEFQLGCGKLTHAEAKYIWDNKAAHLGQIVTFKYQSIGSVDAPRIPVFKSFRDPADMTPEQLELL